MNELCELTCKDFVMNLEAVFFQRIYGLTIL